MVFYDTVVVLAAGQIKINKVAYSLGNILILLK
jgi:hypothetical protein